VRRREFIALLSGAAAWSVGASADVSRKRPLIAVLSAITRVGNSPLSAFVQGLNELGYVDGLNVDIVYRFAEGHLDRFPVLAADVVGLKPDVILAVATPAAVATRALAKSIPIVCPLLADAVNLGLVATDSRPGGNVTGVSFRTEGLTSKQVELALQMIPDVVKIGFLVNVASEIIIAGKNWRPRARGWASKPFLPRFVRPTILMRHFKHWRMITSRPSSSSLRLCFSVSATGSRHSLRLRGYRRSMVSATMSMRAG
jgi:ABC transporter substrate binding protein